YTDAQWRVLEAINGLLPHAVVCLQEQFRDRGEVDFAELAIRARQALGGDDDPTDLTMRLDCQVRHLLVDEFQDTAHSQIDLLLRLTRGWEPGDGRSLFLVGDPMQSIYAFREAEVGHFLAVRDHGLGPLQLQSLRLSANFRSQAGVVNWVNDAFRGIFPAEDRPAVGAIAFEPSQPTRQELPGDAIRLHAFGQGEREEEATRVLELVKQGLDDPDNHSTAILVRGRRHLVAILPALRAANISFRAVELESLEARPEIQDLLALTRAIINPADNAALFSVCRAPWCGLSLAGLHALAEAGRPARPCSMRSGANARSETMRALRGLRTSCTLPGHRAVAAACANASKAPGLRSADRRSCARRKPATTPRCSSNCSGNWKQPAT